MDGRDYTHFDKPWIYESRGGMGGASATTDGGASSTTDRGASATTDGSDQVDDSVREWNVFDNTTITNIELSDCVNAINGFCEHTKNLSDCIDMCANSPEKNCTHGYFIETPDKKNFCVPLRDRDKKYYPYHRLRQKNYYPILENMKSTYFADKKLFPFPVFSPSTIFYRDRFILKHKESGLSLGTNPDIEALTQDVIFSKNTSVFLEILPSKIFRSKIDEFRPVVSGDEVVINIPQTAFVLHRDNDRIFWQLGLTGQNTPANTLRIFALGKSLGEKLTYDDQIYLSSFQDILVYDQNSLIIRQDTDIIDAPEGIFKIFPKVQVSYCDNGECKNISLEQTEIEGEKATYQGKKVYRTFCWVDCPQQKEKKSWSFPVILFLFATFLAVIIYVRFA